MGQDVSGILQEVHDAMKAKYITSPIIAQDIQQAKTLTNFLSILKERAYNRKTTSPTERIQEDIYDLILDGIQLPNRRTVHNLFRRTGKFAQQQGAMFEDDFAAVILSIMNLANPDNKRTRSAIKSINIGSVTGTTDSSLFDAVEEEINYYTESLADEVKKEMDSKRIGFVFGKIDTLVQGKIVNLNGSVEFPPGVLDALSNASFTDKSYRSISYRDGQKIDLGDRQITLGNSDPYRAVMGSMRALGFDKLATQKVFYGGRNIIMGKDTNPPKESADYVGMHIYHLRYMYELTGAGILYQNYGSELSSGAKFMVYNDPMSMDIVVVPTSKIIQDILQSKNTSKNPYGHISISSAYLKAANKT